MHILSPETYNCRSWIRGRERMTVENISWSISSCQTQRSNLQLLDHQSDSDLIEPPWPAPFIWNTFISNSCYLKPKSLTPWSLRQFESAMVNKLISQNYCFKSNWLFKGQYRFNFLHYPCIWNPFTSNSCYPKPKSLGLVVQSVVSLTSSLRVISLTVLADSIYHILIFFAGKMWVAFALQKLLTYFQQKISAYLLITWCKF